MNTSRQSAASAASYRKIAIAAGVFYLITHVTSIGAAALYTPILSSSAFITGDGMVTPVLIGVLFEVILAMANIGTAVALFPVMKRWGEGIALGYVGLRTLEAAVIAVGVIPMLVIVWLRHTAAADPATLVSLGSAFVWIYKGTLLVGPGFICSINTVLMATLMYRSRLVPRFIPILGLIGGPLIFVFTTIRIFNLYDQLPTWVAVAVIPIFAWEVSLALYLIIRGFRLSAARSAAASAVPSEAFSMTQPT
jgi:hypothetical protein